MVSKFSTILYIVLATCTACASSTSAYGISTHDASGNQIGFVGSVDVSGIPKNEVPNNNFIKMFLPKDSISFHLEKNRAPFVQVPKNVYSFPVLKHVQSSAVKTSRIAGGFDGLNQTQCKCAPPDVQVAVGPNHVVETVNADMGMWDKNGTSLSTVLLYRLFVVPDSDILSDPRILFDMPSKRWYLSVLDVTASQVDLAVSATDNPTKSWNVYSVQFDGNCPDQPSIGISSDKLVVSANDFTSCTKNPSFVGAQYFVINKSDLVSGKQNPAMQKFGPDGSMFAIFPIQSLDLSSTLFMASAYGTDNVLHLYSLSGHVPNVNVTKKDLVIQAISMPPGASQRNTVLTVDTNDDRIQSGVLSGGKIWIGLNDGCTPQGDSTTRSCVRLVELDAVKPSVLQDFDIGYEGFYYFYPALTVDSSSRLNLEFGYSSASDYPGLMYAVQDESVGSNGIETPEIFKQGLWYDATGRYGDYFGAAPDPSDELYSWFAGEYHAAASSSWSTFVATTNPVVIPEFPYSTLIMVAAVLLTILFASYRHTLCFKYG